MVLGIDGIGNFLSDFFGLNRCRELNATLVENFCTAITHRRTIRVRYKSKKNFRFFKPYAIYYSPNRKDVFLVCGLELNSKTRNSVPAKFRLTQILEIAFTNENFEYDLYWRIDEFEFVNGTICIMKP